MSTFDYAGLKLTVNELMTEFGRAVTLRRRARSTNDPSKPWQGPNVLSAPVDISFDGVFVPPNTVRQFGLTALGQGTELVDLLRFSEQICIMAQDVDIRGYDTLVDEVDWSVTGFQVLKPGDIFMLAFIGVRR